MNQNDTCPNCGASKFITEPNQYDVLVFVNGAFEIQTTEAIEESRIFCRECSAEVDILNTKGEIVLMP